MRIGLLAVLLATCLAQWPLGAVCQTPARYAVVPGRWPAITSDGNGALHIVFENFARNGKVPDVFYTSSTDHGASWSAAQNISDTTGVSHQADIAVESNGAVDVVWADNSSEARSPDIYFVRSEDGGKSWSKPVDISGTPGASLEPALATGPGNAIYVIWKDSTKSEENTDIFFTTSTDGGHNWSPAQNISGTPGASGQPAIAVSSEGLIHAAWSDNSVGDKLPDIFYCQCRAGNWTKPANVSNSSRLSLHPSLACSRGKVFLTWSDNSRKEDATDIWLAIGNNSGKFSSILNMSDTPGASTEPSVAAHGEDLAVVWSDTSTGTRTPSTYGIASSDNGGNFSNWINISTIRGLTRHPDLTISGGKFYAVWEEVMTATGESNIKMGVVDIKALATGPPLIVDPNLHGASGKMH